MLFRGIVVCIGWGWAGATDTLDLHETHLWVIGLCDRVLSIWQGAYLSNNHTLIVVLHLVFILSDNCTLISFHLVFILSSDVGLQATAVAAMAAAAQAMASVRIREPDIAAVLRKPAPLDLPAVLGAAVAKNQGKDVEAAFRAVGLARRGNEGTGKDDPLSLPHLFWKAVLVVPIQSRGDVGAWLECKLRDGGEEEGKGYLADVMSSHLSSTEVVSSHRLSVEERGDMSCGISGRSRLINRSLK